MMDQERKHGLIGMIIGFLVFMGSIVWAGMSVSDPDVINVNVPAGLLGLFSFTFMLIYALIFFSTFSKNHRNYS